MNHTVKNICIVGGGSAGWLTALWCVKTMPHMNITLIESPNIPKIGVGEATLVAFDSFMKDLGIDQQTMMFESDGVFKSGILFPNWGIHDTPVWHPFSFHSNEENKKMSRFDFFHNTNLPPSEVYRYAMCHYDTSVLNNKVPPPTQQTGYHVDCIKLANYISNNLRNSINYKQEHVKQVEVTNGNIEYVTLETGQQVTADFFIDCTGFAKLLSNSLPDSDWVCKDHMLFNNAAVAGHVRYINEDEELKPYTTCEAVDWGWIWQIPISGRIGSGLVYDDRLISKEDAETYFRNYWGDRIIENHGLKHIRFKPEYNKNNWRGNCFSVGLASGFIEPLESTGLFLLTEGIKSATNRIRKGFYNNEDRLNFNSEMSGRYDESMDFVGLHYMNPKATGPFWDKVRAEWTPTDSLKTIINIYENNVVDWNFNQDDVNFMHLNWQLWLYAVGVKPKYVPIPAEQAQQTLEYFYKRYEKYAHLQSFTNTQLRDIRLDLRNT
jgi:tryptophan halogenase